MNIDNLLPQFNRGNIETPIGFFKTLFRLHEIGREGVLPAIVEAYDRANGIVYVKPLAKHAATDVDNKEVLEDRPTYKVHAVRFMHGGFVVDAPIYKGDTGWIVAGDRNCTGAIAENSTVLDAPQADEDPKNKGASRPSDNSLASFAWGFFIPDSWGDSGLSDADGLVISGKGGKIQIRDDGIYVDGEKLGVKTLTYKTEDEERSIKIFASDDLTIEGGGGGGGGGAVVTTTIPPSDCVLSTGQAVIGNSGEAAQADHVHKLPSTVVDESKLRNLIFNSDTVGKIVADGTADIGVKDIEAGPGISVADNGSKITISSDLPPSAGPGVTISNGTIGINPDGKSIEVLPGSGDARKVQLFGFNNTAANATSDGIGEALVDPSTTSGTRYVLVAVPSDGAYVLKYMPLDQIAVDADANSGLSFSTQTDNGLPVLRLDWDGRATGSAVALRDLIVFGSNGSAEVTSKVAATANVFIPGVKAGVGVTVTPDNNGDTRKIDANVADVQSGSDEIEVSRGNNGVVTISFIGSSGGGQSLVGYTGAMKVCSGMGYSTSSHKFIAQFQTYQVNNGLVMPNPTTSSEDVFTAVEETV